jgi:hypothetical protein
MKALLQGHATDGTENICGDPAMTSLHVVGHPCCCPVCFLLCRLRWGMAPWLHLMAEFPETPPPNCSEYSSTGRGSHLGKFGKQKNSADGATSTDPSCLVETPSRAPRLFLLHLQEPLATIRQQLLLWGHLSPQLAAPSPPFQNVTRYVNGGTSLSAATFITPRLPDKRRQQPGNFRSNMLHGNHLTVRQAAATTQRLQHATTNWDTSSSSHTPACINHDCNGAKCAASLRLKSTLGHSTLQGPTWCVGTCAFSCAVTTRYCHGCQTATVRWQQNTTSTQQSLSCLPES